jgi:hypothetical protein
VNIARRFVQCEKRRAAAAVCRPVAIDSAVGGNRPSALGVLDSVLVAEPVTDA